MKMKKVIDKTGEIYGFQPVYTDIFLPPLKN